MQVQKIQLGANSVVNNRHNNTNFGYNPTVNAELMRKLESSKKNIAFYNFIKNMFCAINQAEVDLRISEKNNKKQLAGLLSASFVPAKILLQI